MAIALQPDLAGLDRYIRHGSFNSQQDISLRFAGGNTLDATQKFRGPQSNSSRTANGYIACDSSSSPVSIASARRRSCDWQLIINKQVSQLVCCPRKTQDETYGARSSNLYTGTTICEVSG